MAALTRKLSGRATAPALRLSTCTAAATAAHCAPLPPAAISRSTISSHHSATRPPQTAQGGARTRLEMIFSFLIASVSALPTNTTGIGPSQSPMPINITNRCGVDGAMDHEFVVTLKPPPANSNGRRLDTPDKLGYLQGWVH
eukprot:scaffold138496_cov63-Phaeocystis_antarctica.AAC.1